MKIIKISAIWCSACLITNPKFYEVMKEYNDIEVIEYDYDENPEIVEQYKIGTVIPVFIILNNNEEKARLIGEKNKKQIIDFIESNRENK